MKILGISSNYHDASAAIVVDGKVIASSAEERFSLLKHDPSFPRFSIEHCLEQADLTSGEIDFVVYHEDPHSKFTRNISSSFANFPYSLSTFIKSAKEMITSGFWIKNEISKSLNIDSKKIVYMPHHLSHAAHAFLTSPFQEAAIMTIDAVGEWSATCFFHAFKNESGFHIEPVEVIPFPHSLGLVYSAFTVFLGFKANDGECSTMALSSFGHPRFKSEIEKIIKIQADGLYEIESDYFDFSSDSKPPLTNKFISIFGKPRSYKDILPFSSFTTDVIAVSEDNQRFADIAASLQVVLEEAILALANRLRKKISSDNLCYGGGVALNCVANSKLINSNVFENVYVPPDPGDGGGAMGAALYASMLFDKAVPEVITPYLGKSYSSNELKDMINFVDPSDWFRFSKIKIDPIQKNGIVSREFKIESDLLDYVAKSIFEGKIIGWSQGRFENGARALGNRSILCRPDSIEVAKRLSSKIKMRAAFRPYACSLTKEEASLLFEDNQSPDLRKWMQASFKIKTEFLKEVEAACHVDGTTRAQVCEEIDNPRFYRLLNQYKNYSKRAALLNTSFNESGFPIVAGPLDVLLNFARTDIDMVVIDNFVIEKKR